ncbi:MAG TPA: c-type cytochrome biogenesis protein CcmI [Roseiarcus sp.]|nr:c-type cytochrome biogenesis protein CcmI [Roseiarcus sp.]
MIWIVFALMTAAAAFCALWPLARKGRALASQASGVAFYKAQLAEIERDVARGQLPAAEAAGARTEAARRLIAASDSAASAKTDPRGETSRRRAAALLILIGVPLVALALYGRLGSPDQPDEPIVARLSDPAMANDLGAAVARIEAHLIAHPEDGRGFKVVAPAYMSLARYSDAVRAYGEALRLLGENPDTRANYGEALVAAAGGVVTAEARAAFDRALGEKADLPKARYYVALAVEQDGDKAKAAELYEKLLVDAPPGAPWAQSVRDRLAAIQGPNALAPAAKVDAPPAGEAAALAALDPAQREAAIRGMVAQLAAKLEAKGDDAEGWLRLIRAYAVLQEPDKAKAALAKAREALVGNDAAKRDLEALAKALGLES